MDTRAQGLVCPEKRIDWPADDHPAFCDGMEERGIRMCPFTSRKAEAGEEAQGCGIGGRGWRRGKRYGFLVLRIQKLPADLVPDARKTQDV